MATAPMPFLPLEYSTLGPNSNSHALSFLMPTKTSSSFVLPLGSSLSQPSAAGSHTSAMGFVQPSSLSQTRPYFGQPHSQMSQQQQANSQAIQQQQSQESHQFSVASSSHSRSQFSQQFGLPPQSQQPSQSPPPSPERSVLDSQTQQSIVSIDTYGIDRMTKEVNDAIQEKAKSIMDQLLEKEESVDKKSHDWEMKLAETADTVTKTLGDKVSAWESQMTDSITTMKTIETNVKNHADGVDLKIETSESMFKKHVETLDDKAKEIHSVGSKFLDKITKMGDSVVQAARDARESLKTTKSDLVKSILSRLDAPIASMLRKAVLQHESKALPLANVSPTAAVLSRSTDDATTGAKKVPARSESKGKTKSMDDHVPTPPTHKNKKLPPSHPSPLDILVAPKRSSTSSPAGKDIKIHSSGLSCITPSDAKQKSRTVFSQDSFLTNETAPSNKRQATHATSRAEPSKRRRAGGATKHRGRGFIPDTSKLGFSS